MIAMSTVTDITVQKLLRYDPHVDDQCVYRALSTLIDHSEAAQLLRVQGALLARLQQNWPDEAWPVAINDWIHSPRRRELLGRIAVDDSALTALFESACNRLDLLHCPAGDISPAAPRQATAPMENMPATP